MINTVCTISIPNTERPLIGLANTIHTYVARCIYGIFSRDITVHTVIYGMHIRFWPTLITYQLLTCQLLTCQLLTWTTTHVSTTHVSTPHVSTTHVANYSRGQQLTWPTTHVANYSRGQLLTWPTTHVGNYSRGQLLTWPTTHVANYSLANYSRVIGWHSSKGANGALCRGMVHCWAMLTPKVYYLQCVKMCVVCVYVCKCVCPCIRACVCVRSV